jgi:hypothetical protein
MMALKMPQEASILTHRMAKGSKGASLLSMRFSERKELIDIIHYDDKVIYHFSILILGQNALDAHS